ncbi:coenzyme a transporter [Phaffia rhodozyma]|uniref:Coenzyme a transporter n=1 Tax=Phaffia rhodozyma TaxID=264483 RepID=A0A0F7SVU3_PHARH|nr:coenzyme a transporter [Phaffia rhodozyma]
MSPPVGIPDEVSLTWLQRSHSRAKADKNSWDFAVRSGIAGGIAGCVAKTAIAPLDRVKILFQTSNQDFEKYKGSFRGLGLSIQDIYRGHGVRGLLQGHLATLLRVFPYAGVKFMLYDRVHHFLMPTKAQETSALLFAAGATSGVAAVFCTYPLELIRVRMAYQTRSLEPSSLTKVIRTIYNEHPTPNSNPYPKSTLTAGSLSSSANPSASVGHRFSAGMNKLFVYHPLAPFYRGFTITVLGMVPYAGISFLTYGRLKSAVPTWLRESYRTSVDLTCGAVAGLASQTASYPFEVVRRRMQVGGVSRPGGLFGWKETVRMVWREGGWKGFYVGLGIGWLKVVPMTSISFTTWQLMKRALDI